MPSALIVAASPFTVAAAFAFSVMTVASSAVAMAAFLRKEFAVEAFGQLLLCCIAYGNDLSSEVQRLSGHWSVEVHGHFVFLDFHDHAVVDLSG